MSAGFLLGWCILSVTLAGAWSLYRLCTGQPPPDGRRFQRTAAEAARSRRTEADVRRDLDKARAALDLADCLAIWDATQHDIPHQTRRTEEDQ